jgi:hypothetical protein
MVWTDYPQDDPDYESKKSWRVDPSEVQQPSLMSILYSMTDAQRLAIFKQFCLFCGSRDSECKCQSEKHDDP